MICYGVIFQGFQIPRSCGVVKDAYDAGADPGYFGWGVRVIIYVCVQYEMAWGLGRGARRSGVLGDRIMILSHFGQVF